MFLPQRIELTSTTKDELVIHEIEETALNSDVIGTIADAGIDKSKPTRIINKVSVLHRAHGHVNVLNNALKSKRPSRDHNDQGSA